jgi:hypothetical protein
VEKLLCPLWAPAGGDGDVLRERLLSATVPALLATPGTRALRLAVVDSAVAPAADKRMARQSPLPDALLSLWLDNAGDRAAQEALMGGACAHYQVLQVTESEPLVNRNQPPGADGRVPGFCQVAFLETPPRLSREAWLADWQGRHTQVAIETQSTFAYRQNVVVRSLECAAAAPEGWVPPNAVVEENFPAAAMTSAHAFYAAGDDAELAARLEAMMSSCARFIDFDRIEVVVMSEYAFGGWLAG